MKKLLLASLLCACEPAPVKQHRFEVTLEEESVISSANVWVYVVKDNASGKEYIGLKVNLAGVPLIETK